MEHPVNRPAHIIKPTMPKPADWYLFGNRMLHRSNSIMQTIIAKVSPVSGQSLRVARRRWLLDGLAPASFYEHLILGVPVKVPLPVMKELLMGQLSGMAGIAPTCRSQ